MKTEQIVILVVAFFLGMLLLNMVKNVCGCEVKEGFRDRGAQEFADSIMSACIPDPEVRDGKIEELMDKMDSGTECGTENPDDLMTRRILPFDIDVLKTSQSCQAAREIIINNCPSCTAATIKNLNGYGCDLWIQPSFSVQQDSDYKDVISNLLDGNRRSLGDKAEEQSLVTGLLGGGQNTYPAIGYAQSGANQTQCMALNSGVRTRGREDSYKLCQHRTNMCQSLEHAGIPFVAAADTSSR